MEAQNRFAATPMQAARYFGVTARTLRYWGTEKGAPRTVKGRYDILALDLWYGKAFPSPPLKSGIEIRRTPEEARRLTEEGLLEYLESVDEKGETLPKACPSCGQLREPVCKHCGEPLPKEIDCPYVKK